MPIAVPRDREGSFEPELVKKGQTRIDGMDDKIIGLYAHVTSRFPQFRTRNTTQTSRGKFSRLRCTVAGSTLRVLDGYGLRDSLPARPTLAPRIRFLSINSHVCSAFPSDPASRR